MKCSDMELESLREQLTAAEQKIADLQAFKDYTHQRFDEAGVPEEVPESPHTAAGCRVGGRFDWLIGTTRELARLIGCLEPNEDGRPSCDPDCVACRLQQVESRK